MAGHIHKIFPVITYDLFGEEQYVSHQKQNEACPFEHGKDKQPE